MQLKEYMPPPFSEPSLFYEDSYLVAVNKPAGLLSVPGRGEDKQDCLASRLLRKFPSAIPVHRLDMPTSGLILFALDADTHRKLGALFEQRKISKTYVAVVNGLLEQDEGIIDASLVCDWPNRPLQKVDNIAGKPAKTMYSCQSRNAENNTTRVELIPYTGRSHQLRVHMQSIGHPIVGDILYNTQENNKGHNRMLLHASRLVFTHPVTGELLDIKSPADF